MLVKPFGGVACVLALWGPILRWRLISVVPWSSVSLPARCAGFPQIAFPRVGCAFPPSHGAQALQRHTRLVLRLLGASPDWLMSRVKPFGGVASGFGFRPGTLGGFGAVSAARLCIVQGGTCTCVLPLCALLARCLSSPSVGWLVSWPVWGPICDGA